MTSLSVVVFDFVQRFHSKDRCIMNVSPSSALCIGEDDGLVVLHSEHTTHVLLVVALTRTWDPDNRLYLQFED